MAKKSDEVRAEMDMQALLALVEDGKATIRVDGKKVEVKLDVSNLSDQDAIERWEKIADAAKDCADDVEDSTEDELVDEDFEGEDDDDEEEIEEAEDEFKDARDV